MIKARAKIGVFGGSGFYDLLDKTKEIIMETPYGRPSDKIALGEYAGQKVAFLARHGRQHQYPPHLIPYRANIYAFKKLGVERIIAPCAAGSLQAKIKPGDFVIGDQFFDRTKSRTDTFFEGRAQDAKVLSRLKLSRVGRLVHISSADPYCPHLRKLAYQACKKLKISVKSKGAVVVIQGPRFSTKAESRFFQKQGWEVINMTQYPENILARELEMCYVNISLITDYDAGLLNSKNIKPVSLAEVIKVFNENNEKIKKVIFEMIKKIPARKHCHCDKSLAEAVIN